MDAVPPTWNALDILVNNVGTNVRTRSLDVTDDDYRRILDTNVTCAWELSRALHSRLAASGRGAIVNVGSVAGQVSVGTGAVYAMSKAAIEHLTRYLAVEWARDAIRVNAVAPWYIRTPLVEPILGDPATLARVLAVTPMQRVGEPHEAAAAIAYWHAGRVVGTGQGSRPTAASWLTASARGRQNGTASRPHQPRGEHSKGTVDRRRGPLSSGDDGAAVLPLGPGLRLLDPGRRCPGGSCRCWRCSPRPCFPTPSSGSRSSRPPHASR